MANYLPQYRLTLYAPRSVDPTEATVLTPATTTVHGDAFKVSTLPGTTFGQPYLGLVRGRAGRLDPLSKNVDVGQLTLTVLDKRAGIPSDNLTRWLTWFVGDAFGVARLVGLKAYVEESLDNGATWAAYFTGRVSDIKLAGKLQYEVTLRDFTEDLLTLPVFVGKPHASVVASSSGAGYAQMVSLLPAGLLYPYANYQVTQPLVGVVTFVNTITLNGVSYRNAYIALDAPSINRDDNLITAALAASLPRGNWAPSGRDGEHRPMSWATGEKTNGRLRLKRADTGATGDLIPTDYTFTSALAADGSAIRHITGITAHELLTEGAASAVPPWFLTVPPVGTTVSVSVHTDTALADSNMLALNDVHPVQLWQDMLDGKFGYLWQYGEPSSSGGGGTMGAPKRTVPYSTGVFGSSTAGFIADPTWPVARFSLKAKDKLGPWIQKNLLQPYQLSYYLDGDGKVTPVDLRRPTALPALTITDADVVDGASPAWEHSRDSAISRAKATYYEDNVVALGKPKSTEPLTVVSHELVVLGLGRSDATDSEFAIDALGLRGAAGENVHKTDRLTYMASWLEAAMHDFAQPFGSGAVTMDLPCRRTANTDVRPGQVVLLAVSFVPDPATNLRGGTRLVRVLERRDEGLTRGLKLLDLGESVVTLPPTLSLVTPSSGNERNGAYVTVTLNAAKTPAEIHRAATTLGAAVPDSSAGSWVLAGLATTGMEIHAAPLPSGHRIYFRGRSLPGPTDLLKRPSSWVPASSNGYVDLATLPSPSALATSSVDAKSFNILFTVGTDALGTMVSLATPSAADLQNVLLLMPGTNYASIDGLVAATCYKVGVTHVDGFGGESTGISLIQATCAAGTALLNPPTLLVLRGGTA